MNINTINKLLGFLVLSSLALVCIGTSVKAQAAPDAQSPEVTALIDRAVIENLMVDYYSHIGVCPRISGSDQYRPYRPPIFTSYTVDYFSALLGMWLYRTEIERFWRFQWSFYP